MIARNDKQTDLTDIWSRLAAPIDPGAISWRQDGKATSRSGKFFARFVCYIEANTARERLDIVVPGEWDLTLELLPQVPLPDVDDLTVSFKARLQILGVIREDVGTGRDYKAAATDAFKRAAVRFGIAHELYAMEQNWVEVDGDGKFAKPLEDPGVAYARRYGGQTGSGEQRPDPTNAGTGTESRARGATTRPSTASSTATGSTAPTSTTTSRQSEPEDDHQGDANGSGHGDDASEIIPDCPKCGGRMWDNRLSKRNPKAPDMKCRDRSCDGVIWPDKGEKKSSGEGNRKVAARSTNGSKGKQPISIGAPGPFDEAPPPSDEDFPAALENSLDDLPF